MSCLLAPPTSSVISPVLVGQANGLDIQAYRVKNRVGESPCWHPSQKCLYWIDVRAQELLKLNPATAEVTRWGLPDVVGALALCKSGLIWLALRHGLYTFNPLTSKLKLVAPVEAGQASNRLNDGKVSPSGRWFVFGSMDDRPNKEATGSLYCATSQGTVKKLWHGLMVTNGIAFSLDAKSIYFSDSSLGHILKADWTEDSGEMGTPSLWCELGESQGRPDGSAIDSLGRYWSAGVSAGCLNVIHPNGDLSETLALPCQAPTMPAFGGTQADTLYVTSLVRPQWVKAGENDGALLSIAGLTSGKHADLLQD